MATRPPPNEEDKKRFQSAMQALETGNTRAAIHLLDQVRLSWGDDPDIWYLLGLAHGKLGELKDVERVSKHALAMKPDHSGALCNLANAQMMLGDKDGALTNYKKSLAINPNDPTVINNYGRALGTLGRREEAIEHFENILANNSDYAPAHASLGKAYIEGGYPEKGFDEYQKALQINPRLADAHLGVGHLYTGLGGLSYAEYHYREALRVQPDLVDAHIGLGNVQRHRGHFEEALSTFSEAEQVSPGNPYALSAKADTLQQMGKNEEAYRLLNELNESNQMPALGVAVFSRLCQTFDVCEDALELINLSVAAPGTDTMEKQMLRFAAGSLLDKLGRYNEAFEWFKMANETVDVRFDAEAQERLTDALITGFSEEAMATLPRAQMASSRPIFILGMPRSGTTLIEQLLASHPDVYGAGELDYIKQRINEIENLQPELEDTWPTCMGGVTEKSMTELANGYLEDIAKLNSEAKHVTDKMPHNFQAIGLINLLFPEARIIHCRRNSLDNGLSIYFQSFVWSHTYATDLANIGFFYREYERLMRHWEQVIDIPMLTVDYEDVIENTEAVSRRILDFCGLQWDDAVMQFHQTKRAIATASFEQVRQPIYKTSRARWKNYNNFIGPLKASLKDSIRL